MKTVETDADRGGSGGYHPGAVPGDVAADAGQGMDLFRTALRTSPARGDLHCTQGRALHASDGGEQARHAWGLMVKSNCRVR